MRGVFNIHQVGVASGTSVVTLVEIELPVSVVKSRIHEGLERLRQRARERESGG